MPHYRGDRGGGVAAGRKQRADVHNLHVRSISIAGREIGPGRPCYIIAELSANHNQDYEQAAALVRAAAEVGADAVKLQTYTADTITLDSRRPPFLVGEGTIWEGKSLYELYSEAYTPWEWQPKLKLLAEELGLHCFSSPFDFSAVDFLEQMEVPAYKIASFELVDIPLIQRVASTGKPVILSTGMATLEEIDEAVEAVRGTGNEQFALLKCNSGYPAPPEEMNLRTIPAMIERYGVPIGLSDHTLGLAAPVAAVAVGGCILEKHLTLSRDVPGPDSKFSLEPDEFRATVAAVREAEAALGEVRWGPTEREQPSRVFRRSLFAVRNIAAGEAFTPENVRSIRPGQGLHPRHLGQVIGKKAARPLEKGEPLGWDDVE
jgi:pseudaminic acid synthase